MREQDREDRGWPVHDIVRRLREHDGMLGDLVEEAADEIVMLRDALKSLVSHESAWSAREGLDESLECQHAREILTK